MAHPEHKHRHQEVILRRAFALIAAFMLVEVVGGIIANSLTLLADAGHMFLDATALGLAWGAMHLSRRNSDAKLSYGPPLSGAGRIREWLDLGGAGGLDTIRGLPAHPNAPNHDCHSRAHRGQRGFVVNLVAFRWLHGTDKNANVRAAALHVLGDLLGSAAAIIAALVVYFTGWTRIDPILALVIAAILGRGAWRVLRDATHILLEGVPRSLDMGAMRKTLAAVQGVVEVHHPACLVTHRRATAGDLARPCGGRSGHSSRC